VASSLDDDNVELSQENQAGSNVNKLLALFFENCLPVRDLPCQCGHVSADHYHRTAACSTSNWLDPLDTYPFQSRNIDGGWNQFRSVAELLLALNSEVIVLRDRCIQQEEDIESLKSKYIGDSIQQQMVTQVTSLGNMFKSQFASTADTNSVVGKNYRKRGHSNICETVSTLKSSTTHTNSAVTVPDADFKRFQKYLMKMTDCEFGNQELSTLTQKIFCIGATVSSSAKCVMCLKGTTRSCLYCTRTNGVKIPVCYRSDCEKKHTITKKIQLTKNERKMINERAVSARRQSVPKSVNVYESDEDDISESKGTHIFTCICIYANLNPYGNLFLKYL